MTFSAGSLPVPNGHGRVGTPQPPCAANDPEGERQPAPFLPATRCPRLPAPTQQSPKWAISRPPHHGNSEYPSRLRILSHSRNCDCFFGKAPKQIFRFGCNRPPVTQGRRKADGLQYPPPTDPEHDRTDSDVAFNLNSSVSEENPGVSIACAAFVGANLPRRGSCTLWVFAHNRLFVRMNSHLLSGQ